MDTSKPDRRTWTDDQLTRAVREANSWRGVLGNLGLYRGGPNEVVKREAARLALDTSHFGAVLRCTDAELIGAVEAAQSWPQLLTGLGLRGESRRGRAAIAKRADELGIGVDHLGAAAFRRRGSTAPVPTPDLGNLRDAAEPLVMAWLQLRGLRPAAPAQTEPYDLLLDTPRGVRRVQVKSTTQLAGSQSWRVGVARHAGGGEKHNRRVAYDAADADLFAILDGALNLYLIPQTAIAGRAELGLRAYQGFRAGTAASLVRPDPGAAQTSLVSPAAPQAARSSSVATLAPDLPARPASSSPRTDTVPPSPSEVPVKQPGAPGRWPEDDLRRAAASARSWADLLRAFGYTPGSTTPREALRQELTAIGIDTSHFTGRRTWSDADLITAAPAARTWAELRSALGLAPGRGGYESVRRTAAALGVSLDHLSLGPRAGYEALDLDLPAPSPASQLGVAAQSIATAWFLLCGKTVSVPAVPAVYDLIVELSDSLQRVQVKSTTRRDRYGSWIIGIGHRPDGASTRADYVAYSAREVNLFFIVDGDLRLYLIPIDAVDGKASLSLRSWGQFIVGDASSLLESRLAAATTALPEDRTA